MSAEQPLRAPVLRDPEPMLRDVTALWQRTGDDLWVFGYASLIWRPEFKAAEHRMAKIHGWHRALRMRSRVNRGTPDYPGLVFALLQGGCCKGMAFRIPRHQAGEELRRLWDREMLTGVYDPRFLRCATAQGPVAALAFTLARHSPAHTGPISDDQMVRILRHARGRYGTTLDYLLETARALRLHGIADGEIDRLERLAGRHGLA